MIEFSLQVEARIIQAVLPELEKFFALSIEGEDYSGLLPEIDDPDFIEAWIDGLKQEAKKDRNALAKLLKSPRLKYGRVEVEEDDIDDILRGLTEIRFTIRKTSLADVNDEELENGMPTFSSNNPKVQIGYFAYLLMAEVQERLIQEVS